MTQAKNFLFAMLLAAASAAQPVDTVKVVSGTVSRKAKLPGELIPFLHVELQARVTGFVESVEVDRGSHVKKDQVLVKLTAPELEAQIAEADAKAIAVEAQRAEAEAKVVAAQATFERLTAASATPGVVAAHDVVLAAKALDAATALVKSLEAAAMSARASTKPLIQMRHYLQIRAPFDGIITQRSVHPGALAGPGNAAPLLTLEQISRLRLVVPVPEGDVAVIQSGITVPFKVPAHPGRVFHASIARIPRSMDARTRTMPIELDVANTGLPLAPGMYAEVEWPTRRSQPSLLVPPTAVATNTERSFVIRVTGGKAEWVDVSKGIPQGELIEVLGALAPGDVILKRATDETRHGAPITIK